MGQQFLDLEGTKILANKIKEGERKIVFVGSENPDTNGWYKVASQTCSGYGNTNITFMVTSTYGNYHSGILQLQIRSDSNNIGCTGFKWLSRIGFDINNFIIVINGMTWTLYAYQPITRYGRICFEILSRSSITAKDMAWTLNFKDNYTKESTTPNATVKSSDGATVNHANTTSKLQTARTINGVSFDGTANISINSMTSNSNITLFADSDSSSTTEYASIKAGGNELKITSSGGGSSPAKNNNNLTFNGNVVYHTGKKPTPSEIGASPSNHNHDDRYYTEAEINTKLNGKSDTSHTHSQYAQQHLKNGFYGLSANGDDKNWVRTTENGIIPFASGTNYSSLGTDSWRFKEAHIQTIYEGGQWIGNRYARKDGTVSNAGDTPLNGNINSIETVGRYRINGESCTGLPSQLTGAVLQHSILEVTNIGNGLIQQRLIPTNNTAYAQLVQSEFTRVRSFSNGWSPWKEIAHTKTVEVTALNGWYFGFKSNNDIYVPSCTLVGNTCTFTATLTAGTVSNGTSICKLPIPAYRQWVHMHCQTAQTYPAPLYLTPDGYLNAGGTGLVKDRVYAISFSYMVARGQNA